MRFPRGGALAAATFIIAGCTRHDRPDRAKIELPATAVESLRAPSRPVPVIPPPGAPSTFADLAARANPSVVFIETEQAMFGGGRRIVAGGVGSGFFFDAGGLILTNDHVVANATRIDVVIGQEDRRRATVVGSDAPTDIAVLRVDGRGFQSLPLGDSDVSRVGDWVLAIGNPFSLAHTVSAGILSAKGRTKSDVRGLDPSGYYDYLQTDASINPGNSGGPLLDLSGRVIGINTAIKPEANSIGFAIPINMVKELLPALIEHGKVRRSAMGIVVASVREEDVTRLGLPARAGAIVTRIAAGGPGDHAGVRVDDVIMAFQGDPVESPNRIRWETSVAGIGKKVDVRVWRARRTLDLSVTLGELMESPEEPSQAP